MSSKLRDRMIAKRKGVTREYLLEHYHYDPETGIVSMIKQTPRCSRSLGPLRVKDARRIHVAKRHLPVTHVIWLMHYGRWPDPYKVIDHINRDHTDNRIENLREVTIKTNNNNRDKTTIFGNNLRGKG